MKKALSFAVAALLSLGVASASHGAERALDFSELTFGIEFTATTKSNRQFSISIPAANGQLVDHVRRAAEVFAAKSDGLIRDASQGGKEGLVVSSNDGDWFFHDDVGVLEVSSPVFHLSQLQYSREVKLLFETFRECGLSPEVHTGGLHGGGGHIHVGLDVFKQHPNLLKRLIIDLHNRPYIQSTLEELFDDQSQSPFELLAKTNHGITDTSELNTFLTSVARASDTYETMGLLSSRLRTSTERVPGIRVASGQTVEFRFFRAPTSAEDTFKRVKLLAHYLRALHVDEKLKKPLEFTTFTLPTRIALETPSIARTHWLRFITAIGLNPNDYAYLHDEKYPALIQHHTRIGDLEVRVGSSYSAEFFDAKEDRVLVELRFTPNNEVASPLPPSIRIKTIYSMYQSDSKIDWTSDGSSWVGAVLVNEPSLFGFGDEPRVAIIAQDIYGRAIPEMTGFYDLESQSWNHRSGLWEQREAKFIRADPRQIAKSVTNRLPHISSVVAQFDEDNHTLYERIEFPAELVLSYDIQLPDDGIARSEWAAQLATAMAKHIADPEFRNILVSGNITRIETLTGETLGEWRILTHDDGLRLEYQGTSDAAGSGITAIFEYFVRAHNPSPVIVERPARFRFQKNPILAPEGIAKAVLNDLTRHPFISTVLGQVSDPVTESKSHVEINFIPSPNSKIMLDESLNWIIRYLKYLRHHIDHSHIDMISPATTLGAIPTSAKLAFDNLNAIIGANANTLRRDRRKTHRPIQIESKIWLLTTRNINENHFHELIITSESKPFVAIKSNGQTAFLTFYAVNKGSEPLWIAAIDARVGDFTLQGTYPIFEHSHCESLLTATPKREDP